MSLFSSWLVAFFLKNKILGMALKVSNDQYPEIFKSIGNFCNTFGMQEAPEVYILNSDGVINAIATRILKKEVFLYSGIVDISIKNNDYSELDFIIGHEMGHHAANHLSFITRFLTGPAYIIPFLGAAYSRACELTADRFGYLHCGNQLASQRALTNLAHGSKQLSTITNIEAFERQEYEINKIAGFLLKLSEFHPRLTKRVVEVKLYASTVNKIDIPRAQNITPKDLKNKLIIGRDNSCDIVLQDPTVSKIHAELTTNNGAVSIRDLGSTNGTTVNGERLVNFSKVLQPYDIVKVGNTLLPWKNYTN